MGRFLTVAAAQMGPGSDDKAENVQRMLMLLKEAARRKVDFVCFVELALTPFFPIRSLPEYDHLFEDQMPSPLTEPLFRTAKEAKIGMILPYAEKDTESGRYYNSAIVVDCDGEVLGKYRKTHIPGSMFPPLPPKHDTLEKKYFAAGDLGLPVFESQRQKAKISVLICYDRRSPEAGRCLALKGAEIVFIPYNTPGNLHTAGTPPDMNEIVLRTRAHENVFYVVGVGRAGTSYGRQFIAGSSIIEAGTGDVLAIASTDGDELISATIDLEKVAEGRRGRSIYSDRRPELYKVLVE